MLMVYLRIFECNYGAKVAETCDAKPESESGLDKDHLDLAVSSYFL